jgi:membrane protease YdiL (CAAX protease family)
VGEEVGWRGYALPQLQRGLRPLPASLILAVAWWLWHLEFFLLDDVPLARFPAYLVEVAAVAIILTWLYNRSGGSILLAVVFHAAYNAGSFSALISTMMTLLAVLLGIVLVVIELRAGRHGRSVLGESPALAPVTGA